MKNLIFVLIILLILSLTAFAQEYQTPDFMTVKTGKGMMVVNNHKSQPFAFLVAGTDVEGKRAGDDGLAFYVDGRTLYAYFIRKDSVRLEKKDANLREILYAHRRMEINNLDQAWRAEINIDDEELLNLKLPENKSIDTLFWSYPRPAAQSASSNRDAFQSAIIGDIILLLGAPMLPKDNLIETRLLLNNILSSLSYLPGQMQTPISKEQPTDNLFIAPKAETTTKTATKTRKIKAKPKGN